MKIAIKIIQGLIIVLLILILAANVWLAVQQAVLHRDPPELFGYSQLVVLSGSMEPEFPAGSLILIEERDSYELGDVVTYRSNSGDLITHRLVRQVGDKLVAKGDANSVDDGFLLDPADIVGGLVTYIPGVGKAMLFLRTPFGMLILLAGGAILVFLPSLLGAFRRKGRGRHAE